MRTKEKSDKNADMKPWNGSYFTRRRRALRLSMRAVREELIKARGRNAVPSLPALYVELDGASALGPRPQRRAWMLKEVARILHCPQSLLWRP